MSKVLRLSCTVRWQLSLSHIACAHPAPLVITSPSPPTILPPQILRDCFSHRHSEIRTFLSALLILHLKKWPKPANVQAVAVGAVTVSSCPWGFVSAAPGKALFGMWHRCLAKVWPCTDQDVLLVFTWWQHPGEEQRSPPHGTTCPSLLESLKWVFANHPAGALCQLQRRF